MISKFSIGLVVGAASAVVSIGLALAGPADDAIAARINCMKAGHGGLMKAAVPIMKGEKPYDAAVLKAAFDADDVACADWGKWWGADTQKGETIKTRASAAIWTDAAGFEAAGGTAYAAMQALKASTDEASFKAAFPAVGASCQGCHEKFRTAE